MGFPCFSAIARSVMISAMQNIVITLAKLRFSAIARSVMISAAEGTWCRDFSWVSVL